MSIETVEHPRPKLLTSNSVSAIGHIIPSSRLEDMSP